MPCQCNLASIQPDSKVSSLINQDLGVWKSEMVERIFLPRKALIILGIPLSNRLPPDRPTWGLTANGLFTTKSSYKLLVTLDNSNSTGSLNRASQRKFWNRLWNLRVPNKIKHFAWRACNNALPTMSNLAHRHISTSDICEQCKSEPEDTIHALWASQRQGPCFKSTCRCKLSVLQPPPVAILHQWRPPEFLFFKANFDAAVFKTSSSAGIGVIICNGMGEAIGELTMPIPLANSVAAMEALACHRAMLFAKEIGLTDVIFEGDSAEVIQAIIQGNSDHPDFGHIIDDIRILASDLNSFQYRHVKRNYNVVADALAKKAKNALSLAVWLEDVPDNIIHLLSFDVP
ncbi:uncharacterized protein LOC142616214 [Castanea sativa]|uniref:uncharacterized protein LOC142616214 n=1 Tax=Castanea sativa TaxID=21020 RepID=UPI003F64C44A